MSKFSETVTGWLLMASLVGGLVGLMQRRESVSGVIDGLIFLLTGFASAIFGAPVAAQWLGITGECEIAGLGFLIAVLWMPIYSRLYGIVSGGHIPRRGGPHDF